MLVLMDWEVFAEQGFGVRESLSAFFDFSPLPSGAIRCVGPFSAGDTTQHDALSAMRDLTIEIEDNHLEGDQFVLWGGYSDHADYREHEISVSGTTCGFVPAAWLRTQLLGIDDPRIDREWTQTVDGLVHRSGLSFPNTAASLVDSTMFHPSTAELALVKLYEAWQQHLGPEKNALRLPVFRWTPTRMAEQAG